VIDSGHEPSNVGDYLDHRYIVYLGECLDLDDVSNFGRIRKPHGST
jgi:hypothetical protein